MRAGLFTDPHTNKKVQRFQDHWDVAVEKSFEDIITTFKKSNLDVIVCGGDFFDKSFIEARYIPRINKILRGLSEIGIPVYFLLGNHEIESDSDNILNYLEDYDNIEIITETRIIPVGKRQLMFIPYSDDPRDFEGAFTERLVFTHHDIFGSSLAAGRSVAKFGIDPHVFKDAAKVLNGHIHSKSSFLNVVNVGSVLSGSQGELTPLDNPQYYIIDWTEDEIKLEAIKNYKSLHFITCDSKNLDKVLSYHYANSSNVILRYEYETQDELDYFEEVSAPYGNILHKNLRRRLNVPDVTNGGASASTAKTAIDLPLILTNFITEDPKVPEDKRDSWLEVGKKLLDYGKR